MAIKKTTKKNLHSAFEHVQTSGKITEYRLKKNDLSLLLLEDHATPTATVNITYRVGSRNEALGYTGATHILEHLMFKGSKKYNKNNGKAIWNILERVGARVNATTWFDRTNYYELLPSDKIDDALAIEADRMRGAFIREEDRQSEMTVVRNEFERGENDPLEALDKQIWATAFQAHPYHHSTIGWRSDIENVSIERLREFYDTFYHPNNATLVVIGDFDTKNVLTKINSLFGKTARSKEAIPDMYTTEPPQEGKRRIMVERSGETHLVGVAHKIPAAAHSDTHALALLSTILTQGKSSRFHRALVDSGLATGVEILAPFLRDPSLFITYVTLTPGTKNKIVEEVVLKTYADIAKRGVSKAEMERAVMGIRQAESFARDGSYSVASNLNEAIALGDWTFYTNYLRAIAKVTPADVQRVAQKYFTEDQSTVGHFIPKQSKNNV